MFTTVHAGNVAAFRTAVIGFADRKGVDAGVNWLTKMNPWAGIHAEREMAFTGDGYTRSVARAIVRGEYGHGPMPEPCACGGVFWYRATCGSMKCDRCGELAFEGHDALAYVMEDRKQPA